MELDEFKEAERFVEEFKQIDFQVPFDNLKRETVTVDGRKYYKDLYLVEKLLPTLTEAMIALSKELEELMNNTEQIDPEVRSRFNPCIFLGQYLMRHNHNLRQDSHLTKLLTEYSKVENMNRYFVSRFESIYKIFVKSIGKDKKQCDISELKLFLRDLDQLLDCKGELRNTLGNNKNLTKNKDDIKFNEILDELSKFIVAKTKLGEKDFEKVFIG